jgi:outer membrane protein assembly factor BamB
MVKSRNYLILFYFILIILITINWIDSVAARTVNLTEKPFSGIYPLEVKLIVTVAPGTSAPTSYEMDFGDGSSTEIILTNEYLCVFTHTYQHGFFRPQCTVRKELGILSESLPGRVIVAKWKFETNGEIDSSPAVGPDGIVYVGSDDGNLYAVDPETGLEKWRFPSGGKIQSSPAVSSVDGTIFFGSLDNTFYALNKNGSIKWTYNIGDFVFSSPAISSDGRVVYVGASNNTIYSFNASIGALRWKVATGGKIVSSPAIGYDGIENVVYVGSLDHHVYALSASNGQIKWKFETSTEVYGSPAIGSDGRIYFGECRIGDTLENNYKLFCINVDGSKFWEFSQGTGFYSSPAIGPDDNIYIGSWDGYFLSIRSDGTLSWSTRISPPRSIYSSPAVGLSRNYPVLYVGAKDGNFYAFQTPAVSDTNVGGGLSANRQDWIFTTGDDILNSSPAIDQNGTIYFGSHDKNLYAVQPGNINIANSPWPIFHHSSDHSGAAQNIQISPIISSSPSPNFSDIDVNTNQIIVNFSPDIKTTQILINTFEMRKVSGNEIIEGQTLIKYKKYNNKGYNVAAIFTPNKDELPLKDKTKYKASIKYFPSPQTEQESTYSWSFTTEAASVQNPNPSPESDWSCFIDSIYPQ